MKIIVNDQLVEYKDEGAGKVILLFHGWGANLKSFDNISNHLSKKFRVVRFDFPGFGNSPKPNGDWLIGDYAEFTRDFLKKIKVDDVFAIVAHSFGGRVTIKGVISGYFDSKKLVFIGVAGVKPPKTFKKTAYKAVAKVGKIATSLPLISKMQPMLKRRLYS
jgi:pimeloyl-ACP methyl ester carboxylesterase